MSAPPLHVAAESAGMDADSIFDPRRIAAAVWRYKWGVIGLAIIVTVVTALFVYTREPVYRAQASIVLETNPAKLVAIQEMYSSGAARYDYFLTQYEILKSRRLAELVAAELNLVEHSMIGGAAEPESSLIDTQALKPAAEQEPPEQLSPDQEAQRALQKATSLVSSGLVVSPVQYSHLVYLRYESTDAKLASDIVNTLARMYIEDDLRNRTSGTKAAEQKLTARLTELRDKLSASEARLQAFRKDNDLVDVDGVTSLGGQELKALASRLDDARRARVEAENVRAEVARSDRSLDELLTVPAVLQHELIRGLKQEESQAQRRVDELSQRYGVKHPRMIAARTELDSTRQDLRKGVERVVGGISREYEVAARNERELDSTWSERRREIQDFNDKEFELRELQRAVEADRQLYEIFFTRVKETEGVEGFDRPHARILDPALVPTRPIRPNKQLSVTVALICGLLLGCVAAVVLDVLDDTVRSTDDVLAKLASPLLGTVPQVDTDDEGHIESYWSNPQSLYAEAVRTLRTGVMLSNLDDPAKVIVVTSSVEGEGKSTITLNLAAALGQMERTLVIGADLRRPSLAQRCNLSPNHPGLSHFVAGSAELEDCIEYLDEEQIHVMPAGVIPPNPLEMISSRKFVEALNALKQSFARIVIDSAPVHAVSDPLVLASYADAVIYVVKADSTSATLARRGIERLVASNEPLTGVVLNQFVQRSGNRYYGGDGYYSSYTAKPDSSES